MILWMRWKIWNYIKKNTNKAYSEDFPLMIGNLLPPQYEKEGDNFDFERFYSELLLKLFTEAENVIIYVTPLVFNIDLDLVIYHQGKETYIENKNIPCGKKGDFSVRVLYNTNHYELGYNKEDYEKVAKISYYVEYKKVDLLNSEYVNEHRQATPSGETPGNPDEDENINGEGGEVVDTDINQSVIDINESIPVSNQNTQMYKEDYSTPQGDDDEDINASTTIRKEEHSRVNNQYSKWDKVEARGHCRNSAVGGNQAGNAYFNAGVTIGNPAEDKGNEYTKTNCSPPANGSHIGKVSEESNSDINKFESSEFEGKQDISGVNLPREMKIENEKPNYKEDSFRQMAGGANNFVRNNNFNEQKGSTGYTDKYTENKQFNDYQGHTNQRDQDYQGHNNQGHTDKYTGNQSTQSNSTKTRRSTSQKGSNKETEQPDYSKAYHQSVINKYTPGNPAEMEAKPEIKENIPKTSVLSRKPGRNEGTASRINRSINRKEVKPKEENRRTEPLSGKQVPSSLAINDSYIEEKAIKNKYSDYCCSSPEKAKLPCDCKICLNQDCFNNFFDCFTQNGK